MIIYIAGAMMGLPNFNREEFNAAAEKLKEEGHTVLNPAFLPDGLTEKDYMAICLPMVMASETVFMLSGWEGSKGAKTEHSLAVKCGIPIEYQKVEHRPSLTELKQELEKHWRKPLVFISTPCSRVSYIHPYPESEEAPYVGFQHGATLPTSMMETIHIQAGAGKTPKDTSEKVEAIEKQKIHCPFDAVIDSLPWLKNLMSEKVTEESVKSIDMASKLVSDFFNDKANKPNGEPLYYLLYKYLEGKHPLLKTTCKDLDGNIVVEMKNGDSLTISASLILETAWGKFSRERFELELDNLMKYRKANTAAASGNAVSSIDIWMGAKGIETKSFSVHGGGITVIDMAGNEYQVHWEDWDADE